MTTRWFLPPLWLAGLLALATAGALSQEAVPPKASPQLPKDWDNTLMRAEKALARPDISDTTLEMLAKTLSALQWSARQTAEELQPETGKLKEELAALGPAPLAEGPPEPPTVAERRKIVGERLAAAEGIIKEAGLIGSRTEQVLERVSALKRVRFTERILTRGLSPLDPAVWRQAIPELSEYLRSATVELAAWLQTEATLSHVRSKGWKVPAGVVAAILLAWPLRFWLLRRFGYIALTGEPTYRQRLRAALFTGVIRSLAPSAAAFSLYLSLLESELLSDPAEAVARVLVLSVVFVFFAIAFCWAALAPTAASWRLVPVTDQAALAISRIVTLMAAVFALDWVIDAINEQVGASIELITVQEFVSGLTITGLLFALLRPRIWQTFDNAAHPGLDRLKLLRLTLGILVCAIPLSAGLGYVALSRLLATQFVQSAGLFVLLVLLIELGSEMIDQSLARSSAAAPSVSQPVTGPDEGTRALGFWLKAGLRFALLLGFVVMLPLIWGVGANSVTSWLADALTGVQVGPVKISLLALFWAAILFASLLIATRLLQRTLEHQIFPRTRLDIGLRNSIRAAVGYIGFTLAGVLAISAIGIDLSNLALIAGALSVGVGLGLQNVVSNFVSGVILLVERPIKVGDWVVIGEHQGYVKRISVRATELTTFDRGSVFIPNSNLIANPVMNRTYADPQGRVIVPVGLAYGTDTQRVRRVLLDLAAQHPEIQRSPAPTVLFRAFGDSALQFELVAFIADVNRSLAVSSDLCFAIDEAFAREGIEFPHPRRDVSLSIQPEQIARLMATWDQGKQEGAPIQDSIEHDTPTAPATTRRERRGGSRETG